MRAADNYPKPWQADVDALRAAVWNQNIHSSKKLAFRQAFDARFGPGAAERWQALPPWER